MAIDFRSKTIVVVDCAALESRFSVFPRASDGSDGKSVLLPGNAKEKIRGKSPSASPNGSYNTGTALRSEKPPSEASEAGFCQLQSGNMPRLVTDAVQFVGIAEEIALADAPVAIAVEIVPRGDVPSLRFLNINVECRGAWHIDLQATGNDLGELRHVIESGEVVGHDIKKSLAWLSKYCDCFPRRVYCTRTASSLLSAGGDEQNALGDVVSRYLDIQMPSGSDGLWLLGRLHNKLKESIRSAGLNEVSAQEMALIPVLVKMEGHGFPADRKVLGEISVNAEVGMAAAVKRFRQEVNEPMLNVSSSSQVLSALRKIGIKVADTSSETISAIDHDAARALIKSRAHQKTSQQATNLLKAISQDGCIHTEFDPLGTVTGRLSSRKPNLQNIMRGVMRTVFRATPGNVLLVADYAQIELRAAAAIAATQFLFCKS